MPLSRLSRLVVGLAVLLTSTAGIAQPFAELQRFQGAWVPDGGKCEGVFYRQGSSIYFRHPGATVREGILVHGKNRIDDARNRCHIKKVKATGEAHSLLISCLSGLVTSDLSFSVRFIDDDTVVRSLTEFPEDQVRLRRCKI